MPLHTVHRLAGTGGRAGGSRRTNPVLIPLFRDLSRVMEQVSKPIATALEAHVDVSRRWLLRLHFALTLYSGAARVVFATHLHELAEQVAAINGDLPGDSLAVSMVSSRIEEEAVAQGADEVAERRTYRVVKSSPAGRSYALELARHYGNSFDQLRKALGQRGVLDNSPHDCDRPTPADEA